MAAAAVLIAVLLLPVLQIYGSSMYPTIQEGQIVVSVKGADFTQGDVIAFYYNTSSSPVLHPDPSEGFR